MCKARCFLVIAEDPERLTLLSATLFRRFPNSVVHSCCDAEAALLAATAQNLEAIIAHRSTDMDEIPLLEYLRAATSAPIIALSGYPYEEAAKLAGASRFLHLEQSLLISNVVAEVIGDPVE